MFFENVNVKVFIYCMHSHLSFIQILVYQKPKLSLRALLIKILRGSISDLIFSKSASLGYTVDKSFRVAFVTYFPQCGRGERFRVVRVAS